MIVCLARATLLLSLKKMTHFYQCFHCWCGSSLGCLGSSTIAVLCNVLLKPSRQWSWLMWVFLCCLRSLEKGIYFWFPPGLPSYPVEALVKQDSGPEMHECTLKIKMANINNIMRKLWKCVYILEEIFKM